jgi:hypothetical protein
MMESLVYSGFPGSFSFNLLLQEYFKITLDKLKSR